MTTRCFSFLAVIVVLMILPACRSGESIQQGTSRPAHTGVLDGEVKSILVNGYSTSYAWPAMLQDMLDDHADADRRLYHIVNSVVGGAPVEIWIAEPGTRDYQRTFGAMERDFFGDSPRLLGDVPRPTIAICQQSLQFTMDRRGPVKAAADMVGAELGADVMEKLATRLREYGIERVYVAMHIYKKPVEPEVGNERIALQRLLTRGHEFILEGPDVWTPTRDAFPDAFEDDELHPNEMGMKIMAEGWYRTLAGDSARQAVIDAMWARQYDIDTMMRAYLAWRRGEQS